MIRIEGLERTFTSPSGPIVAVRDLSLELPEGAFGALFGPSGCGKTTTLRMVAGLEHPDRGRIEIAGRTVVETDPRRSLPPHRRGVGMVFQSAAVWPHLSVAANVAYPLRRLHVPRTERDQRVTDLLELVGLSGLGRRRPAELSGGQQQRVAIARALAHRPRVLLLDEPFSSLDEALRRRLGSEVRRIQQELGITVLYVTHDRREVLELADTVAVMRSGELVQVGTPRTVYERPRDPFVAELLGATNLVEGRIVRTLGSGLVEVETPLGTLSATLAGAEDSEVTLPLVGSAITVSIRVGAMTLLPLGRTGRHDHASGAGGSDRDPVNRLTGRVVRTVFRGPSADSVVRVVSGPDAPIDLMLRLGLREVCEPGSDVEIHIPAMSCVVLPSRAGRGESLDRTVRH